MLIIAAVLFVLGMLVRKYPNLIAGYNTMTAEQKKNVDVKGLSNFMCRSLCVIAVLMIVSYFVMVARSVNEKAVSVVSTTLIPIIGSIYMVVKAQRYDRNGKTGKPVGLKRGISGTINEWLNAAEYIAVEDKSPVIFIERGIRTYETATRNTFDLSAVPLMKKLTHFPVIVDPSHGTGIWDLVPPMARAGVASGADGMIVEIHPDPANAWSDGPQSLNEKTYSRMMKEVAIMKEAMEKIQTLD